MVVFACLHFLLAVGFALKTPYRTSGLIISQGPARPIADIGSPDERQHANYIRFLLKKHKLPVLVPGAPDVGEEYESHQPPVYYAASAAVATVTGQTDVDSQSFGNVERIFNCAIGALAIVGVFFAGLWASKREDIAILSAAFAALLPSNCSLSGSISNDPLLILCISWSFAFSARAFNSEEYAHITRPMLCAAVFAGLACITKSSGLVALAGLFATAICLRKRVPVGKLFGFSFIAILIALPVWLRNITLYGDPLAQNVFKEAFGGSAQKSAIIATIEASGAPGSPEVQYWMNWVGYWTARSFIGVFGYMDIWLNASGRAISNKDPNWLYKAIIAFLVITKIGFLFYLRNKWKEIEKPVFIGLLIAILTLLVFIGFNMTYFQAQGRYLLPALAPTAMMLSFGWTTLFRSKMMPALVAVVLIFGGTTVYALTQLTPEFALRQSATLSPQ